jgi:hypothetical protein
VEDRALVRLVKEEGMAEWSQIAMMMELEIQSFCRNGKQCRERWYNHLDGSLSKRGLSQDEQLRFLDLFRAHGNSWSAIARAIPGRSENLIKNHFYSTVRRFTRSYNACRQGPAPPSPGQYKNEDIRRVVALALRRPPCPRAADLLLAVFEFYVGRGAGEPRESRARLAALLSDVSIFV